MFSETLALNHRFFMTLKFATSKCNEEYFSFLVICLIFKFIQIF